MFFVFLVFEQMGFFSTGLESESNHGFCGISTFSTGVFNGIS